MTNQERSALGSYIRKAHGYCMDTGAVLSQFLADHPNVSPVEARSMASMCHGVPFPSIRGRKEGAFPVYPERSAYYDARFHEGIE